MFYLKVFRNSKIQKLPENAKPYGRLIFQPMAAMRMDIRGEMILKKQYGA